VILLFQIYRLKIIKRIESLHAQFLSTKTGVVIDSIILKSKARGVLVANAIMKYAATDNFLTVKTLSYTVPPRDSTSMVLGTNRCISSKIQ
jgi:hypothetical protein